MSSYRKSSQPVIVHDDRHQYQRQPSADSYYSRSSTGSSASYYSTMPNGNSSSSGPSAKDSTTYRSAKSRGHLKDAISKNNVMVINHNGSRGWDQHDPHPEYRAPKPE